MPGTATGNAIQSASGGAVLANPVTIAQGGTGQTTAASAFSALSPLTTQGDLIIENSTPAPARLAVGTAGVQMLGVASGVPAWLLALQQQAATANAGYTLINGTGTIISWTTPNDGNNHRFMVVGELVVTSNQTGGAILLSFTSPDVVARQRTLYAGGLTAALQVLPVTTFIAAPNTSVIINQNSAQTVGASVLWVEIWGC